MPHPSPLSSRLRRSALLALAAALAATATPAQGPPCQPCAGVRVDDPVAWLAELGAPPRLVDDSRLYVAWDVAATAADTALAPARRVAETGATPWIRVRFETPPPMPANARALDAELESLATFARQAPPNTHYQVVWPASPSAREYAFLFKRAAVALTGATTEARIVTGPLPPDLDHLEALYAEEIAAYADGVAVLPGDAAVRRRWLDALQALDPGKPAVLDALDWPERAESTVSEAARAAKDGVALAFFRAATPTAGSLAPLKVMAAEVLGDLAYDQYSAPSGPADAFSFVRGEDLGLRVIAEWPAAGAPLTLAFTDSTLERPQRVDLGTGEVRDLFGIRRTADGGVRITVDEDPRATVLLRLERPALAELAGEGGLVEELTITGDRTIPVEEILRRLQANEDAQERRLSHYRATNTTHLRFQSGTGVATVEATFEGDFFHRRGEGFDWAWQSFLVNGVRWRGKRIPEIPLVQPEKAAALPLEILFNRDYRYRLRGSAEVDGRDCWVVDFEPAVSDADGALYQGTVWVDRRLYRRVRTRGLQVGLEGEVISNEETLFYTPLAAGGGPADWEDADFVLPLRVVSDQVFSVLNGSTAVEKEVLLTGVEINGEDFAARRDAVLASDSTMLRDTDEGLKYLVVDDETGERVVQEGFDSDRLFLAGGVFYDDSFDYPLPLGGVNYFSFDFRGTGAQANVFFAGVLLNATLSDPDFLGSRFDVGVDVFGIGIALTDEIFRDGRESPAEDVEVLPASVGLTAGHPVGQFGKVNVTYELSYSKFSRADSTADDFVLPEDHLTHTLGVSGRYNRRGWRLRVGGDWSHRSTWQPWGLPGQAFDPDTEDYARWGFNMAKNFHLPKFQRVGLDFDWIDGRNLDRFSKYSFGFFSPVRVHGYQSSKVQAEEAYGAHGSYGFELGEVFRVELVGDAVWATDEESGLDSELLGGVGLVGQFLGPWQTLVQIDAGVPVAGPDDGFVLFLAFLKLFR